MDVPTSNPAPISIPAASLPRPRRRWKRRVATWSALLLLGLAGLAVGLTQGPGAAWLAGRIIRGSTGCDASVSWASLKREGRLVLNGVSIRAPGVPGLGGEIVACERVEADFEWSSVLSGNLIPTGVRFYKPVIRISESEQGLLNIAAVGGSMPSVTPTVPTVPKPGTTPPPRLAVAMSRLPRVELILGAVELGEHQSATGEYASLARLTMGGWLDTAKAGDKDDYQIELREGAKVDPDGLALEGPPAAFAQDAGVLVRGRFNSREREGAAAVTGVALEDWNSQRVPRALRETWEQMAMKGKIASTTFTYSPDEGIRSTIAVQGVSMNVPIDVDKTSKAAERGSRAWLKMQEVNGTLTFRQGGGRPDGSIDKGGLDARIRGKIEDLPLAVSVLTTGLDPDTAGFTCEIMSEGFKMSRSSALMPFLPSLVTKRLAAFSGPSAEMDARVVLRRAQATATAGANSSSPPVPRPLSVSGSVTFSKGRAAFEQFPYPIFDLSGLIQFDDQKVTIESIRGRGPTGASLLATGAIWPPDDADYCDLRITVADAPIDEFLALALDARRQLADAIIGEATPATLASLRDPSQRGDRNPIAMILGDDRFASIYASERSWRMGLFDAVFSKKRHAELVARGVVGTPETPFRFGGQISELTVTVHYAPETKGHYDTDVAVVFKNAGIVPEAFPLPIIASNLWVKIRESEATLGGDNFKALGGGTATLQGRIDLTNPERTAAVPELWINAKGLAVGRLLENAVPVGGVGGGRGGSGGLSPRRVLHDLNLTGQLDCDAHIFTNDSGEAGYDLTIDLNGLTGRPLRPGEGGAETPGRLEILDASGQLRVTERDVSVRDLVCGLRSFGSDAPPRTLRADAVMLMPDRVRDRPATQNATLAIDGFDFSIPVEDMVRVIAPAAASTIEQLRQTYEPVGRANAFVTIASQVSVDDRPGFAGDLPLNINIETLEAEGVEANLLGGRLGLNQHGGTITASLLELGTPRARTVFMPESAVADLTFNGQPCGEWLISGRAQLPDELVGRSRWTLLAPLQVNVTGGFLESGVTRNIILSATSAETLAWFEKGDVRGGFDADVTLKPGKGPSDSWFVSGRLVPDNFALTRRGTRTELSAMSGAITLVDSRGRFDKVEAATADWQVGINGAFNLAADNGAAWTIDADLSAAGIEIQPTLLSLLPEPVESAFKGASMTVSDGFTLDRGRLFLKGPRGSSDATVADFDGLLSFQGLAADVGVTLKRGRGTLAILASLAEGEQAARARLDLDFENVIAAGVPVAPAGATIATGRNAGDVSVPVIFGEAAGGRLSGLARVDAGKGPLPQKTYQARINLAGVRFADLLSAFKAGSEQPTPIEPEPDLLVTVESGRPSLPDAALVPPPLRTADQTTGNAESDSSRGVLDAELAVGGVFGDVESRTGRGSLRIAGGEILQIPLVLPLIEMSNFQLPSSEKLDFVHSAFHIKGRRMMFDELAVLSSTVSIVGSGQMTLPEMTLDLRFNSQSRARVPLLSDVLEGLRNEIVTTTVRGTIAKPEIGASSFSGTQRLLDSIFGGGAEGAERGLGDSGRAERTAREQRSRHEIMDPSPR